MQSQTTNFELSPLITVARLATDWRTIFDPANRPRWARVIELLDIDPESDVTASTDLRAIVVIGRKHRIQIDMTAFELAVLFEMTRFGHTIVSNSNFNKPRPQIYAKMRFAGASEDLMSIRRILWGAKANEATKPFWRPNDYSAENTYAEDDSHPDKDARSVALGNVERLARERQAAGITPMSFDVDAYLDNIKLLFAWIDNSRKPTNFHPADPRRAMAESA